MRSATSLAITLGLSVIGLRLHAQTLSPRERFARGVALAAEGDHRTALTEFRAAYEATQNPEVLFNIAATHEQLNEYVEALEAVERYQRLAPPRALQRHRRDVVAALARLTQRVGTLRAEVPTPAARCSLDGREVSAEALRAGLRVSAGQRTIRCEAEGHEAGVATAEVASGAVVATTLPLSRRRAEITVVCDRPGAEVRVDGVLVGRYPLTAPLRVDEGTRRVELSHPGYESVERTLDARGVGARVEANLRWLDPLPHEVSAPLLVRVSEPLARVTLDGRAIAGDARVMVPPGAHRLRVTREDFLDVERDLRLTAGVLTREDVALQPTPAHREAYLDRVRRQRVVWRVLVGTGAILAAGGATVLGVTLPPYLDADQRAAAAQALFTQCSQPTASCTVRAQTHAENREAALQERAVALPGVVGGAIVAGLGLIGVIVGSVLAADAEPLDRFDRPPRFRVAAAPGGVAVVF